MLLQLGVHVNQENSGAAGGDTNPGKGGEDSQDSSGDEWFLGSSTTQSRDLGPRAARTEYPIFDFSVLVKISRGSQDEAQEAAWAALLR